MVVVPAYFFKQAHYIYMKGKCKAIKKYHIIYFVSNICTHTFCYCAPHLD